MKNLFVLSLLLMSVLTTSAKDYLDISSNWKFRNSSVNNGQSVNLNENGWATVNLPYSWNGIDGQDGGGNYRRGDGWYRKRVSIPFSANGKSVYIDIGAANMTTTVYVNGNQVGQHIGGYARFTYDITKYVTPGQDATIAIKVNNEDVVAPPRHADFTFSGGIQRSVRLIIADKLHIAPTNHINKNNYLVNGAADIASPGVKVRQYNVSDNSAKVDVTTRVRNNNDNSANATAEVTIYDRNGNKVTSASKSADVNSNGNSDITSTLTVNNPHLWNGVKDPYLYKVVVVLKQNGKEVDRSVQPLGLRYYSVSKTDGFMLNGKSYPLHGFAFHDELIDKGRAETDADRLRDLQTIRNAGVNYVRLSHYQHGDYTYNFCDSVGIICWTEIPCIDYMSNAQAQNTFQQNAATQLYELIRQEYNHPSVCFWGLCNEIRQSNRGADVPAVITALHKLAKEEDDTRLTTLAHDKAGQDNINNYGEWKIPDVIAVNKYVGWYEGSRNSIANTFRDRMNTVNNTSSKPIGMSEYGAGGSPFTHNADEKAGDGNGKPNHPEEYQAYNHEQQLGVILNTKWFWATSCWCAFDFASDGRNDGEDQGINDKGLVTHDRGVKKDAYYLYQANLANFGMVHIKSRRFVTPGNTVSVKAYSNCTNVQMRINGGGWRNMQTADSKIKLYKIDNVNLNNGANIIEVQGKYNGKTISDKVVWYKGDANNTIEAESGTGASAITDDTNASGSKYAEVASGNTLQLNYNAPEEGTYTMRIFYMTKQQRRMDVSANGYSATHYFGETGGWNADKRRAVVMNVYLKKGKNTISFNNPEGATPNLDYVTFYYYHEGKPDLEDNPIQTLIPIPNNPNAGAAVPDEPTQPDEPVETKQYYIYNVGQKKYIKTGGQAKTPDTPELVEMGDATAQVITENADGTITIADPEWPYGWGFQGRNTVYISMNGGTGTNSWGTNYTPGFKLVNTGDADGSVYIEYTWPEWTKGRRDITDPSNKTYVLTYGNYDQSTDVWSDNQKNDVANPLVFGGLLSNLSNFGANAKWLFITPKDYTGINTIDVDAPNANGKSGVYTLSGQRVATVTSQLHKLPKGVYIINGKKVIVK